MPTQTRTARRTSPRNLRRLLIMPNKAKLKEIPNNHRGPQTTHARRNKTNTHKINNNNNNLRPRLFRRRNKHHFSRSSTQRNGKISRRRRSSRNLPQTSREWLRINSHKSWPYQSFLIRFSMRPRRRRRSQHRHHPRREVRTYNRLSQNKSSRRSQKPLIIHPLFTVDPENTPLLIFTTTWNNSTSLLSRRSQHQNTQTQILSQSRNPSTIRLSPSLNHASH
jgi:hypothetical protein